MQDIESRAIETYNKNLEYLSKHHESVFQKVQFFSHALENASLIEKYALDYKESYFDVKELASGHYLYAQNSINISKKIAAQVNMKKDDHSFEGFPIFACSKEQLKNLDDISIGLEGVFPIVNHYIASVKNSDSMKKIEKFIFIGTGLGFHLSFINEKIHATEYLIVEDDLELFRLSLFTTKYYELALDARLYFTIDEDENQFTNSMRVFLNNDFFTNRFIKYSYFTAHSKKKFKYIQNALSSQPFVTFPYKSSLDKFLRPLEYINDGYNVLNLSTHFKNDIFSSKPVLILTAGPSFQKNIEFLHKNHNKFIIVAVSSLLKKLYSEGIVPDVVTHLDGFDIANTLYEDFPAKEFLKDSIAILGPYSPYNINQYFTKENIFRYEESTFYFKDFSTLVTPCVGSFSLLISLLLDTKETYLLGLDLALNQETGATHSSEHISSSDTVDIEKKEELSEHMGLRNNVIPVSGNFTKTVYTTSLFHSSIQALYNAIPQLKKSEQSIYNLNDGAKINEASALKIQDMALDKYESIDKQVLRVDIKNMLLNYSRDYLDEEEVVSMKKRLQNTKIVRAYIEEYSNTVSHSNTNKYLYDLLGVVSNILHMQGREADNLSYVYDSYFRYILPIIFDLFNTKNIKNEKRHIKKIDKLIQEEMYNIVDIYQNALEKFIKEKI